LGICPVFDLRYIFTSFLFLLTMSVSSQDTLTVDQLDYQFVSFSEGELLPLTSPENTNVAGLFISCQEDIQFEFCGALPFTIWIDGRYAADSGDEKCLYISNEVLCAFADRENPYLSVVSEAGLSEITARTISIESKTEVKRNELSLRRRSSGYWILGFLMSCILLIGVRALRSGHTWRFQRPNLREFSNRFITLENMILLLLLALVNAISYSFLAERDEMLFIVQSLLTILEFWITKIFLVFLSGMIFKNQKASNWQLIFQLQFWLGISLIFFVVLFFDFVFFAEPQLSHGHLMHAMALSALVFLFLTSMVFMTQKGRKKLHIFIYLCTTEILPITFLVYWFLK